MLAALLTTLTFMLAAATRAVAATGPIPYSCDEFKQLYESYYARQVEYLEAHNREDHEAANAALRNIGRASDYEGGAINLKRAEATVRACPPNTIKLFTRANAIQRVIFVSIGAYHTKNELDETLHALDFYLRGPEDGGVAPYSEADLSLARALFSGMMQAYAARHLQMDTGIADDIRRRTRASF